jgi:hypothetical protein
MKNPKIFFLIFLISSCSSPTVFLTDQKEGWFKDHEFGLVYCKASLQKDGSVDPVCFESAYFRAERGIKTVSLELDSQSKK